ncbi:MAG: ATP-binding cassette domain-containing protein [Candidatus Sumerlaeaceae bacterium]
MIRVDNLTKHYGDVHAVDGLSFELFEGEILGFLGPNGAGKTTTMRILTCFFPPTSGTATVAGYDVLTEPDEVRRLIGYMPEGVPLYREMTVTDFLDFVGHSKGYGHAKRRTYVDAAIGETNLGDVRNRVIGELSKGYRQRVGLAQAILGEPKVLILDEPTSGLDPRQIADMRVLIKGMAGRRTVILSTHILPEVQMTCSRVIIIDRGRIAASGTPEKLTTRIQNRFQTVARAVGPPDEIRKSLAAIAGVLQVDHRDPRDADEGFVRGIDGQAHEYVVHSGIETPDIRPAVAEAIVRGKWTLVELRQIGLTLEDIFLKAVAGEQPAVQPKSKKKQAAKPVPVAAEGPLQAAADQTPAHGMPRIASQPSEPSSDLLAEDQKDADVKP